MARRPSGLQPLTLNAKWPQIPLDKALVASAAATMAERPATQLRVLTWNVWFDNIGQLARQHALIQQLVAAAPDVVGLQEVVGDFAESLRACEPLTALYDISPYDVGAYGVLLLTRRDLQVRFSVEQLPTGMGRNVVLATFGAKAPGAVVASTHLESLENGPIRRAQLQRIAATLRSPSAALFGDFNFDSRQNFGDWRREAHRKLPLENMVLEEVMPDFADAWPAVRADEGFTFDGATNPINVHDPEERMRYDRVMARKDGFRVLAAELLGTEAINDWDLRPSDHYGLQVDLELLQPVAATDLGE